jgi:plastocyanin
MIHLLFLLLLFQSTSVMSDTLTIMLTDQKKKAIENVIAYVTPLDAQQQKKSQAEYLKKNKKVTIQQRNKMFSPYVSVLQRGTKIELFNHDPIKHHVYSFSNAKQFEIPLYSGKPPKEITLNKAGVVTLGCNIHDWMLGYILVIDTPFFAKSNAQGRLQLNNLPHGKYHLKIWHPQKKGKKAIEKIIQVPLKEKIISFQVPLKTGWKNLNKPRQETIFYDDDYGLF